MKDLKVAVIYYSATGTNHQLAQWAAEAAKEAGAGEVKFFRFEETAPRQAIEQNEAWKEHHEKTKDVPVISLEDFDRADCIIFSMPTRYGNMPSQAKSFIDTTGGLWSKGKLANKVVTGMTSAGNTHGGQETTLLSLYKTMHHWGAITVTPAYTDEVMFNAGGNPYGVSVNGGKENLNDKIKKAVFHQAKRTLKVAGWVKKGLSEE